LVEGDLPVPVVLIMLGDPDANSVVAGMLSLKGYSPLKAKGLQDCFEILTEQGDRIDAVTFGGSAATESGGMLISRIKKANPNIKVLAIADRESDRASVMRLGADQVAIKPLSSETVADKLTLLLAANGVLVETNPGR
jgi:DNA-binding response OmpR family regulator